jgi:hypothetical protein
MAKKLVILVGPQLDGDSYSEANFVVRIGHSISWHIVSRPDESHVAGLARIKLIYGRLKRSAPTRGIPATTVTSIRSSTPPRPEREDKRAVHRSF